MRVAEVGAVREQKVGQTGTEGGADRNRRWNWIRVVSYPGLFTPAFVASPALVLQATNFGVRSLGTRLEQGNIGLCQLYSLLWMSYLLYLTASWRPLWRSTWPSENLPLVHLAEPKQGDWRRELPSTHHSELWTAKEVEKHIIDIDALRTCEAVLLPEKILILSNTPPPPQQKKWIL